MWRVINFLQIFQNLNFQKNKIHIGLEFIHKKPAPFYSKLLTVLNEMVHR